MSTHQTDRATPSTQPTNPSPPSQSGSSRLIVLLLLLGLATGAFAYDYFVARPGVDAADARLSEFVDTRNRLGVKEGGQITPEDIHKALGMQPTWVDKHDDDHYEVEYYCWRGPIPVVNMWKHYISVVYTGDGTRHISAHYKNERPPREGLPIMDPVPPSKDDESLPAPGVVGGDSSPGETKKADSEKASSSDAAPSEK